MPITTTRRPSEERREWLLSEICKLLRASSAQQRGQVREWLLRLERDYAERREAYEDSPGIKESNKHLKKIVHHGQALLNAIGDERLAEMAKVSAATDHFHRTQEAEKRDREEHGRFMVGWSALAPALEEMVERTKARLTWTPYRGNPSVQGNIHGTPIKFIVRECARRFLADRPSDKASGSRDGDLYELARYAIEFITGLQADEDKGIGLGGVLESVVYELNHPPPK